MRKFSNVATTFLVCGILFGGLSACQKREEPSARGPAEQAGRQIDQAAIKANEEASRAAEKARQDIANAAEKTNAEVSKAADKTAQQMNSMVDKTGQKVERAGEKMQETARSNQK
ncbi:hypothetical protein BH11PSE11_BH11PSE11_36470 [soil metagenome]